MRLSLQGFTINLKDMELIHANAPKLEYLNLKRTRLVAMTSIEDVVSGGCTRLVNKDGSDIVKTSTESIRDLELHIDGKWNDNLYLQATI